MTTYVPFTPTNANPPFQQVVTLDGLQYGLSAFWNMYRADWYYSITDQDGNVVITAALIESPPDYAIYLAPGIFQTSTILYRASVFEVNP